MQNTPKGLRIQIGIFGKRNAGKSSVMNTLSGQQVSIVSDVPGTTADPVEKAMEMLPLGPVLLIDTAGLDDDAGYLGELRNEKSRKIFERADLALLVSDSKWGDFENDLLKTLTDFKIPCIAVFNKMDLEPQIPDNVRQYLQEQKVPVVQVSAHQKKGFEELKKAIVLNAPESLVNPGEVLYDLVGEHDSILLITPIDKSAPQGRLIMPQVQTIRDVLDHNAWCTVCNEKNIPLVLSRLNQLPDLAVTDSQVFSQVDSVLPDTIPLTSFSILMARLKGDLTTMAEGAAVIERLTENSRVLIAEACSHRPLSEDIGTVKIPHMLRKKIGEKLRIDHASGHDFPANLKSYDLVIHCGACTFNRKEMLTRILNCRQQGVPITNYGMTIAQCTGILKRALTPFPGIYQEYMKQIRGTQQES